MRSLWCNTRCLGDLRPIFRPGPYLRVIACHVPPTPRNIEAMTIFTVTGYDPGHFDVLSKYRPGDICTTNVHAACANCNFAFVRFLVSPPAPTLAGFGADGTPVNEPRLPLAQCVDEPEVPQQEDV